MHMCEYVLLGKLHESRHPIILMVQNNSPTLRVLVTCQALCCFPAHYYFI